MISIRFFIEPGHGRDYLIIEPMIIVDGWASVPRIGEGVRLKFHEVDRKATSVFERVSVGFRVVDVIWSNEGGPTVYLKAQRPWPSGGEE